MVISTKICAAVFFALVRATEPDGGQWNYLLHSDNVSAGGCPHEEDATGTVDVSFTSNYRLPLEENRKAWVKVWAECQPSYRWDDQDYKYYRSWICDATTVIVDP